MTGVWVDTNTQGEQTFGTEPDSDVPAKTRAKS